jgi:hypothetical protein
LPRQELAQHPEGALRARAHPVHLHPAAGGEGDGFVEEAPGDEHAQGVVHLFDVEVQMGPLFGGRYGLAAA